MNLATFLRREHPRLYAAIDAANVAGIDTIDLSSVGPEARRYVWECLKAHRPDMVALLSDPQLLELKAIFGARIELESRIVLNAIARERAVSRGAIAA